MEASSLKLSAWLPVDDEDDDDGDDDDDYDDNVISIMIMCV